MGRTATCSDESLRLSHLHDTEKIAVTMKRATHRQVLRRILP